MIIVGAGSGADDAWAREKALLDGLNLTRSLVTEPANVIYPETFVARCREEMEGLGVEFEILDESAMKTLGMGAEVAAGIVANSLALLAATLVAPSVRPDIALAQPAGKMALRRAVGKVQRLAEKLAGDPAQGELGIAHSRWAPFLSSSSRSSAHSDPSTSKRSNTSPPTAASPCPPARRASPSPWSSAPPTPR